MITESKNKEATQIMNKSLDRLIQSEKQKTVNEHSLMFRILEDTLGANKQELKLYIDIVDRNLKDNPNFVKTLNQNVQRDVIQDKYIPYISSYIYEALKLQASMVYDKLENYANKEKLIIDFDKEEFIDFLSPYGDGVDSSYGNLNELINKDMNNKDIEELYKKCAIEFCPFDKNLRDLSF